MSDRADLGVMQKWKVRLSASPSRDGRHASLRPWISAATIINSTVVDQVIEGSIFKILIEAPPLDLSQYVIKFLAFEGAIHETLPSSEAFEVPGSILKL